MCACRGSPAPRPEARQRHDYRRRSGQDSRLRRREVLQACLDVGPGATRRRRRKKAPSAGRRSARSATCLPNRRSGRRSMRARIFSRWESCFSRWRPGERRSRRHAGGRLRSSSEPAAALAPHVEPALPTALSVIDKALEKDPERRYRSANEFLDDLRRVDPSTLTQLASRSEAVDRARHAGLDRRAAVRRSEPGAGSGGTSATGSPRRSSTAWREFPGCA